MTKYFWFNYVTGELTRITPEEYRAGRDRVVRFRYTLQNRDAVMVVTDVLASFSDVFKAVSEEVGEAPISTERV